MVRVVNECMNERVVIVGYLFCASVNMSSIVLCP